MVRKNEFTFSKPVILELHSIWGKEEVLNWGEFRTDSVTISGSEYKPRPPKRLDEEWSKIESELSSITDGYNQAVTAFLRVARAQFFWDVNKRMGRFMMNGILLSSGFLIINVPAKKQGEFNQLMLDFYSSAEMS